MKKGLTLALVLAAIAAAGIAYAQSTANPVIMGFLKTSGCPGNAPVCFVPYSATDPMPVACQ